MRKGAWGWEVAHAAQNWRSDRLSESRGPFLFGGRGGLRLRFFDGLQPPIRLGMRERKTGRRRLRKSKACWSRHVHHDRRDSRVCDWPTPSAPVELDLPLQFVDFTEIELNFLSVFLTILFAPIKTILYRAVAQSIHPKGSPNELNELH